MRNKLGQTPSQTVGPYFAYGLTPGQYGYALSDIAGPIVAGLEAAGQKETGQKEMGQKEKGQKEKGQRIRIEGVVNDGQGVAIDDAMIEIWQADSEGCYPDPASSPAPDPNGTVRASFGGFARCGTGTQAGNQFYFETIKPGAVRPDAAPYIDVVVFARGLLNHVYTRLYFDDEAEANARDPVLSLVPEARQATLIAKGQRTATGLVYRFDIHMQGPQETVFFDF